MARLSLDFELKEAALDLAETEFKALVTRNLKTAEEQLLETYKKVKEKKAATVDGVVGDQDKVGISIGIVF
jgi:hypothetical protein